MTARDDCNSEEIQLDLGETPPDLRPEIAVPPPDRSEKVQATHVLSLRLLMEKDAYAEEPDRGSCTSAFDRMSPVAPAMIWSGHNNHNYSS